MNHDEFLSEEKKWAIYEVLIASELFSETGHTGLKKSFDVLDHVKLSEVTLRNFKDKEWEGPLKGKKMWGLNVGNVNVVIIEGFVDVDRLKAIINE